MHFIVIFRAEPHVKYLHESATVPGLKVFIRYNWLDSAFLASCVVIYTCAMMFSTSHYVVFYEVLAAQRGHEVSQYNR